MTFHAVLPGCAIGRYGADCKQECHCKRQDLCDRFTGSCALGCASGWRGPACQIGKSIFILLTSHVILTIFVSLAHYKQVSLVEKKTLIWHLAMGSSATSAIICVGRRCEKNDIANFVRIFSNIYYGAPCVKQRNIKFCIIFLVNFG